MRLVMGQKTITIIVITKANIQFMGFNNLTDHSC